LPRSGTSWVGRTIADTSGARLLHEPFNITGPRCSCGVSIDRWFLHIGDHNADAYRAHLAHLFDPRPNFYRVTNLARQVLTSGRVRPAWHFLRSLVPRPLVVKDPLALLSAEWLAREFGMRIVVVVRHPAAVAHSYARLGWNHPFEHFVDEPGLLHDLLEDLSDDIERTVARQPGVIERTAVLWKVAQAVTDRYREERPDWIFVRYEDLVRDPAAGFRDLLDRLGLRPKRGALSAVRERSLERDEAADDPYSLRRDGARAAVAWRNHLTPSDVRTIRRLVGPRVAAYYPGRDW